MSLGQPQHGHLPIADRAQVRRAAGRLVRRERGPFGLMIVLNVVGAAAGLAGPWVLGFIIDEVRGGAGPNTVDRLALLLVTVAVMQIITVRYARHVAHRFGERTAARIREQFVERALRLPTAVAERAGVGDLTARGAADVQRVSVTLRDAGPDVLIAGIQALLLFAAMFLLHPLLGLCGLAGLAGIAAALRWYLRRARTDYLAQGATESVLAEIVATTAAGARTVETFGLRQRRTAACERAVESARRSRLRTLLLRSVLFPAVDMSQVVPMVAAVLVGALLVGDGAVTVGVVVTAVLYMRNLAEPLASILLWTEQIQSSGASFARIEGVELALGMPGEAAPSPTAPLDERIELSGVYFAYDDGPDVVRGVDLVIRPGERLAVVGPSGAGKSTLARLLAGIDTPRTGAVTVGRVPVAGLDAGELRRHVVLVTQEQHVFLGTVRDNVLIADEAATDDALWAALATVGADWVRELPDGLDTELGDGRLRLDGARVQQIALARVVVADPHTIVLDEATALLDPATARHTEQALAAVLHDRTVIAIAHRLHTAQDADRIAVMDGGQLVELGTHDELVAAGGHYASLWRA